MDDDLRRAFNRSVRRQPIDSRPDREGLNRQEWTGTGLCAEAQADGVPCTAVGRACDECGRALTGPLSTIASEGSPRDAGGRHPPAANPARAG